MKTRLFTPGPTEIHPRVAEALARPILNHRKPAFAAVLKEVREMLTALYRTRNPVVVLSCSGSGALEAAARQAVAPGDLAFVVKAGKFGERFVSILKRHGADLVVLEKPWGQTFTVTEAELLLKKHKGVKAIFCQHSETSTGTAHPVQELDKLRKAYAPDALLVVDAITSLGCMEVATDEWGLDMVVSASQKALMCPPGLAFVSLSAAARERMKVTPSPSYYLDLSLELKKQEEGATAFTPAIGLVMALREALDVILTEGIGDWVKRTHLRAAATRAAAGALGLELLSTSPADSCTAIRIPDEPGAAAVVKHLEKQYGLLVAGGQDALKGKIVRFAHLGHYDVLDTLGLIACFEMSLSALGMKIKPGAGVAAAQRVFLEGKA